ncbi:class I SAM-dependent methyltransferase [Pseudoalteromonas neustonica]|uniref:Class I SAM-dependent methyltransferase n=1 Tax=Pseudoalteromonas neustonica TaxID=1840331 RepID=A0ABU9TXM0_9GAMM
MSVNSIDYYNQHSKDFIASSLNVDMSALYAEFTPLLPKHALILDAGCGTGRDTKYFIEQGFNVTAIDASKELVEFATNHIAQPVIHKTFMQIDDTNIYDGIWCCASLLHVPKSELSTVFTKLATALKANGILYVSFKYGDTERVHNGREFTDLTEHGLQHIISAQPSLCISKHWITGDQRTERGHEQWLNAIIRKEP